MSNLKARVTASENDRKTIARGVNDFTFALYAKAKQPGDCCISPFSAALTLALLALGAKGNAQAALERTLGFSAGPANPHLALGAILAQSEGGGDPFFLDGMAIPPHELIVADSVWVARNYVLDETFEFAVRNVYAATVGCIDVTEPAQSAERSDGPRRTAQVEDRDNADS